MSITWQSQSIIATADWVVGQQCSTTMFGALQKPRHYNGVLLLLFYIKNTFTIF